jgi:hypothetical protein
LRTEAPLTRAALRRIFWVVSVINPRPSIADLLYADFLYRPPRSVLHEDCLARRLSCAKTLARRLLREDNGSALTVSRGMLT